ncbi:MAG: hypothetical protein ACRYG5_08850 [Janthinobacterium lividum]
MPTMPTSLRRYLSRSRGPADFQHFAGWHGTPAARLSGDLPQWVSV